MNYLNGGYIMVKSTATQTELKNAYDSKKPVIVYDVNGYASYATIVLSNDTYAIVKMAKEKQKYRHYIFSKKQNTQFCITIDNYSNADITTAEITAFIQGLPANAIYPVTMVSQEKYYDNIILTLSIQNKQTGGSKFGFIVDAYNTSTNTYTNSAYDSQMNNLVIDSQYAIEI